MKHRMRVLAFVAAWAVVLPLAGMSALSSAPPPLSEPQYDGQGQLKRPADFQSWVFVGSNLGLQYRKSAPAATAPEQTRPKEAPVGDFHHVYIRPESYEAFRRTGTLPDLTVLVTEVYEAEERDPKQVLTHGLFPGNQRRIEVAVKNGKRPDGSKTDWAYYVFDRPTTAAAKAFPDADCYACHLKHASVDNVWVQFYPVLRSVQRSADK